MRLAYEEKVHANDTFRDRYFAVPKEVNKKIPLTMREVQRMMSLDLSDVPYMELSRNIFVLGCFLGLRVSDLKQISPLHIHDESEGKYINIKTVKTGVEVRIPLNSIVRDILEAYGDQLPKFNEQVVNRHLKILAVRIGLNKIRASKLSIHYSRATFAKLTYEMGIPSLFIMKVTGHTTEKNFLRYVNISPEEAVTEFRKHDFFK